MKKFFVAIAIIIVCIPSALQASTQDVKTSSFQQFQKEVNKAYSSHRMSLFQTSKNNREKSLESALDFQQQWQAITEKYGGAPPEVYATDPEWEATLLKIGDINALAIQEILVEKLSTAHDTLEAIRDELGALRQRNQVITFSDHVNNYHAVMESLLQLGLKPNEIDSKILSGIRENLAVLEYLAKKMQDYAPAEHLKNDAFNQAMNGVHDSLRDLRQAVNEKNPDKVVKTIKALKPAYAMVFVKFG